MFTYVIRVFIYTYIILILMQCLQEIRRELLNISLTFVYNGLMSNQSICDAIKSIRHRFLRIIGDYKMASGQPVARLAFGSNVSI